LVNGLALVADDRRRLVFVFHGNGGVGGDTASTVHASATEQRFFT